MSSIYNLNVIFEAQELKNDLAPIDKKGLNKIVDLLEKAKKNGRLSINGLAPSVFVLDLLAEQAQKGGIFIQIFQRFHTTSKSAISDLMDMFKEVCEQNYKNNFKYIHTASVMCINDNAKLNNETVFSVFDGQHRTVFFVLVVLSLIKMAKKANNEELLSKLTGIVFKNSVIHEDNFILKYADPENNKLVKELIINFKEYLDTNSKTAFTSFINENNSFTKSFELIEKEVKVYVSKLTLEGFFDILSNRISVILRFLKSTENEILIFLYENKERIPFAEFEAVKMITTSFFDTENEKLDYAKKFSEILHWLAETANLTANDIAHALRVTFMDMEKFCKKHIAITVKADKETRLSEIIKENMQIDFSKRSDEFLFTLKQYLFLIIALKKGDLSHESKLSSKEKEIFHKNRDTEKILRFYSNIYLKAGTSGQRFTYLALPKLKKLIFTNELVIPAELKNSPLKNRIQNNDSIREDIFKSFLKIGQTFMEIILTEFFVIGNNVFKPYELAFDEAFVDLIELTNVNNIDIAISKLLCITKVTKENLEAGLLSKKDWNEIHSDSQMQNLILALIERFTYHKSFSAESVIEALIVTLEASKEHIIPYKAVFSKDEIAKGIDKKVMKCQNYWFYTVILEKELNSKASNHDLNQKLKYYPESSFLSIHYFLENKVSSYIDMTNKDYIKKVQKNFANLILENISFYKQEA